MRDVSCEYVAATNGNADRFAMMRTLFQATAVKLWGVGGTGHWRLRHLQAALVMNCQRAVSVVCF